MSGGFPGHPVGIPLLVLLCVYVGYARVPVRARFRSDNYAAVLRLQSTQPKDWRIYTALTGILA